MCIEPGPVWGRVLLHQNSTIERLCDLIYDDYEGGAL